MIREATIQPVLGHKTMTHIPTALTIACLVTAGSVLRTANAEDTKRADSDPGADIRSSVGDGLELDAQVQPFKLNFGALQDDSSESPFPADDWRVSFNSWIWLVGIDGDIGVRDLTVDVSADFVDVLDAADSIFAFSGRLEIGKGRWGGFIDGMYEKIGIDDVSGPFGFADVDITFEMSLVDFGVMYRVGEWTPDGEAAGNSRDATVDLYGGARSCAQYESQSMRKQ